MRLGVSNIAWDTAEDGVISQLFAAFNVRGLEVAPTKAWPCPLEVSESELYEFREFWESRGIQIIAAQSLLYGRADLQLFDGTENRVAMLHYLEGIVGVISRVGARAAVFGSPKNRVRGDLPLNAAKEIAAAFFSELAEAAHRQGVVVCLEANVPAYRCDFIQTTEDALEMVKLVNRPGFKLQLDIGTMIANSENFEETIDKVFDFIGHLHISEPGLAPIGTVERGPHRRIATSLRNLDYKGWASIEMKSGEGESNEAALRSALAFVRDVYF